MAWTWALVIEREEIGMAFSWTFWASAVGKRERRESFGGFLDSLDLRTSEKRGL